MVGLLLVASNARL